MKDKDKEQDIGKTFEDFQKDVTKNDSNIEEDKEVKRPVKKKKDKEITLKKPSQANIMYKGKIYQLKAGEKQELPEELIKEMRKGKYGIIEAN
jgi:hypothetical protein